MEQWQSEFQILARRKMKTIASFSYNVPSRRFEDELGEEIYNEGFRSIIFYFKLTPNMDLNVINTIVKCTRKYIVPGYDKCHFYATLFINDVNMKLLHPPTMVSNNYAVLNIIKEYYENYELTNQKYSGTLTQLFPMVSLYTRLSFPTDLDLCVIFTDEEGIKIDDSIIEKYNILRRNFIWIKAEKNKTIEVKDNILFQTLK